MTQADSLIGFALVIDQQRKLDAGSLAEELCIAGIAQTNNSEMSAFLLELGFECAQLRDVLSAEDSTVVAKKDHHCRLAFPQRAEARWLAIGVRECDSGQLAAE